MRQDCLQVFLRFVVLGELGVYLEVYGKNVDLEEASMLFDAFFYLLDSLG